MAKTPALKVVIPNKLLTAPRSKVRPADQTERGTELRQETAFTILNNTARNYKTARSVAELVRHLARAEGPFATAVHNMVEVASTDFTVTAYDAITHQYSEEGTLLAQSVISSLDTLYDFTEGYSTKRSLEATVKMMMRESILTGGIAAELVLNKSRLPDRIQVVGMETLTWISDGKGGAYPAQNVAGENEPVPLNIATFWVDYVHPDPNTTYPRSLMEAAIKLLIYFEEFMEDIRRVVRQSGHNRQVMTLDAAKIKETAPREVQNDPKKLAAYFEEVRQGVQDALEQIEPEQALVLFDSVSADVIESGMGTKLDYTPLLNVISGQYATSMKTPPSVLGLRLESGSQALGNVETVMFLKSVGALHTPVETILSRVLTLSCRLFGLDVYVRFKFDPIDLRPEMELEAFKVMRQTRILEQLSLGFITDAEAANLLKTGPRAPNSPPLSGTMFHKGSQAVNSGFPGDTAVGRTLQPDKDVPRKAGGSSQ